MELAALYDLKLGRQCAAFLLRRAHRRSGSRPHRVSASRLGRGRSPRRARPSSGRFHAHRGRRGHRGIDLRIVRVEASGFHGREPGEDRWAIDQGNIDSWSTRLTLPARQKLERTIFLRPHRQSGSAVSRRKSGAHDRLGDVQPPACATATGPARSCGGALDRSRDNAIFDSYLFESTVRFRTRNYAWTRFESAERSNELILGENPLPPDFVEQPIGHVQAYTFGYDHDFRSNSAAGFRPRRAVHHLRRTGLFAAHLWRSSGRRRCFRPLAPVLGRSQVNGRDHRNSRDISSIIPSVFHGYSADFPHQYSQSRPGSYPCYDRSC